MWEESPGSSPPWPIYLDGVLEGTVSERGIGEVELLRANFAGVSSHPIKLLAVASSVHRVTFDAILALRQPGWSAVPLRHGARARTHG